MNLISRLRFATHRPDRGPTSRRRPSPMRPALEGLEERVVMHAGPMVAPLQVAAQVQPFAARATQQVKVPITVTGINITSLTRDATTGVANLAGTLTGTILGQTFTTPLTGTITPGRNPRSCPVLNLHLGPIHLSVLGLNVNTSDICLNINAQRGRGLLGSLLCGGLTDVLNSATSGSTSQATTQLNNLLNNGNFLNGLTRTFGQARTRVASLTPAQPTTTPVLNLSLGPVRLNLLGLRVKLDNCQNGPVTVNITATAGGGLLGDLLSGLTGGAGRALTRQVAGVLQQITNTNTVGLPTV